MQGDFDRETAYGDPLEVAESYVAAGAERLHVVDLDAALTGVPLNRHVIGAIAGRVGVAVQAGGGVRDEASAEALFSLGVARVVLGTAAVQHPKVLEQLALRWPHAVLVGLDYRRSDAGVPEVAVRGWTESSGLSVADVLAGLGDLPLAGVVATDIARDGTGDGPDLAGLAAVLESAGTPVVASGGVAGIEDLQRLAALEAGGRRLGGAVVGRALLSGRLSLAEALAACGTSP
jgi:phosphoribosylformimino-5-aminoimidazole carboxamide ribotide isomerase